MTTGFFLINTNTQRRIVWSDDETHINALAADFNDTLPGTYSVIPAQG